MPVPDPQALTDHMRQALRSEYGARSLYRLLARFLPNRELRDLLGPLVADETRLIGLLKGLIEGLGASAPHRSRRRAVGSFLVLLATPLFGSRVALRLCIDAEETLSRWYLNYAGHLAQHGEPERARLCTELALAKERHAQNLQTWVDHGHGRHFQ